MLVSDLLDRLDRGDKLKNISESLSVSVSYIQRRLAVLGYKWDNSAKRWNYIGEQEEPRHVNILEVSISNSVNSSSPSRVKSNSHQSTLSDVGGVKQVSPNIHQQPPVVTDAIAPAVHTWFTRLSSSDLDDLRDMLDEWKRARSFSNSPLHERIQQLNKSDKQRRTVIIPKKVSDALDDFVEKFGVEKSDVYALALLDFMERYQ